MKDYSRNIDQTLLNKIVPFLQEVSYTITDVGITRNERDQALRYLIDKFEEEIESEINEWIFSNFFIIDKMRYAKAPLTIISTSCITPFKISLN